MDATSPPHGQAPFLKDNLSIVKALLDFLVDKNFLPVDAVDLALSELGPPDLLTAYQAILLAKGLDVAGSLAAAGPLRHKKEDACRDAVYLAMQACLQDPDDYEYWFTRDGDEEMRGFAALVAAGDEAPAGCWEDRMNRFNGWISGYKMRVDVVRPRVAEVPGGAPKLFAEFLEERPYFFPK